MKKIQILTFLLLAGLLTFMSCEKEITTPEELKFPTSYKQGAFVLNEGSWGSNNASLSIFSHTDNQIFNNCYKAVNNDLLGDVFQSMTYFNEKYYFVLNGSKKIVSANFNTLKYSTTSLELTNPRYIVPANEKLYVTQWDTNSVSVINPVSLQVETNIKVGAGPEGLLSLNDYVLVANSGGWGCDSTVSVINTKTMSVEKKIQVGYSPKEMVTDNDGNVWVLCSGYTQYDEKYNPVFSLPSSLVKIDGKTLEVTKSVKLFDSKQPCHLDINKDKTTLYFGGGYGFDGIYAFSINNTEVPATAFISGYYYGFNVNPENGDVYCGIAPSFTENGTVEIYSDKGTKVKSFTVGIGPNAFFFPKAIIQ